jgi:hypothetical protein
LFSVTAMKNERSDFTRDIERIISDSREFATRDDALRLQVAFRR